MKKLIGVLAALISAVAFAPVANAEPKMRVYKDLGGQTQSRPWWEELAGCGGTLAAISMEVEDTKPNEAKVLEVEANKLLDWAGRRLVLDDKVSKEAAEEKVLGEGSEWTEYYVFEAEAYKEPKELVAYQQKQLSLCRGIANEYKAAFPQDAN